MNYKCKSEMLNRLLSTHKGFVVSLCDSCKSEDCTNSIETRKVSILGVKKDMKIHVKGYEVGIIVSCEGYIK